MKKAKPAVLLILLITLLFPLMVACGGIPSASPAPNAATPAAPASAGAPTPAAAASAAPASIPYPNKVSEPLTLWKTLDSSHVAAGYPTANEIPAVLKWEADTGVDLVIKEFADNNALILAIQADTLPDMLMFDYTQFNGGVLGLAAAELVKELTPEMFQVNAPDYWKYINSFPEYMKHLVQLDGKMYQFSPHVFEPNSIYRFWKGFIYRQDILDANKLTVPATNAEFAELLKSLKGSVPGIVTPWTFNKDEFTNVFDSGYITSEYGLVNTKEYLVDGVYHYGAYEPEYKDVLAFANGLYKDGLISTDFTTMDGATAESMLLSGQSAVLFGNNSRLNTLLTGQPPTTKLAPGPVLHPASMSKAYFSYADPYVVTGDGVFITPDSKHTEQCLQFLNYLYTDAGNLVRNFGTEGVSYTFVNGIPTITDLIKKNPNGYSLDAVWRSHALINWAGIHADVQNKQRHPNESQVVAYGMWSDTDVDKYTLVFKGVLDKHLTEYTNLWVDIDTYIKECRAKFISGEMSLTNDFDSYISKLKAMGMDRVIEIKQETYNAWIAR